MGLLTKEVDILLNPSFAKYYESKGYKIRKHWSDVYKKWQVDLGQYLTVKVEDLKEGSHELVMIQCDICGEVRVIEYREYVKMMTKHGYITCVKCCVEKRRKTNLEKYGVTNPMQNKDIREKAEQTNVERYGVRKPLQNKEIKKKAEQTMLKNYGVDNPTKSQEIKDRVEQTNIKRYGFNVAVKNPEVAKKLSQSLYDNGKCKTSSQQIYLNDLYNGKLNHLVDYFFCDIALTDEMIDIEYDGSGHFISIRNGSMTEEQFNNRELHRSYIIRNNGYREMRIISKKDKLPSDDVLLEMLEYAKRYFSTSHSWIVFDIDNSCIYNSIYPKDSGGLKYNYGKLRSMKKRDIERIA